MSFSNKFAKLSLDSLLGPVAFLSVYHNFRRRMSANKSAMELLDDLIAELSVSVGSQPNTVVSSAVAAATETTTATKDGKMSAATKKEAPKETASKELAGKDSGKTKEGLNINCIDLRVGRIVKVERHPTADKLYVEEIDVGEDTPRPIASGLVPHYSLEEMQDRMIVVICNLKPRNLVGFKSHGMVLCAAGVSADGSEKVEFVEPPPGSKPGDRIVGEGLSGEPLTPNQVDKQKAFEAVATGLLANSEGVAVWNNHRLVTSSGGVCKAPTVRNGALR